MPEQTLPPATTRPPAPDHARSDPPATLDAGRAARVAGLGYLVIFVLAVAANTVLSTADLPAVGTVPEPGVAVRVAVAAFLVVAVVDVLVAWALHVLLAPEEPQLSLLAAWLRVVHAVLMTAGAVVLTSLGESVFTALWMAGLLFFGGHLVLLASLLRSRGVAPWLPRLLTVAGAAYALDTLLHLTLADYDAVAPLMLLIVAVPSVVGELWLAVWLVRGAPVRRTP